MKKLKKVLAFTIAFAMVLSTVAFAAVPNDVEGTDYEEAASVLGMLKIMQGDDGGFRPNDTITRAEFAAVVARSLDLEDAAKVSGGATEYTDVPATHWAAGYINLASNMGIINGYGNGEFGPEDTVKYEQAITMIVRALGYEPAAKAKGGYPVGYLYVASNEGVTDDVDAVSGTPALRGDVAQLVYNSLTVVLMEQDAYGDDASYQKNEDGENLLTYYLDVNKYIGVVVENNAMDDDVDDEEVVINVSKRNDEKLGSKDDDYGDGTFEIGETDADALLGYEVEFYADDDDVLISIIKTDDNEVIVDEFDNLGEDTDDYIETKTKDSDTVADEFIYETDDDDEDIEEEGVEGAIFVLNGKKVDYDQIVPGSGKDYSVENLTNGSECIKYTLINSDSDSDYDFVIATAYETIVVDDVNLEDKEIYSKNNSGLDLDDDDYIVTITDVDGDEVELKDIEEWDVLAVAKNDEDEDDADVYTIIVINDSVEGEVEEVNGDDEVVIEGEEYDVLEPVDDDEDVVTLEIGDEGTFYLDMLGRIVAVDVTEGSKTSTYGYLIDSVSAESGFNSGRKFKILTASGDEVVYDGADDVEINDDEYDADRIFDEEDDDTEDLNDDDAIDGEGSIDDKDLDSRYIRLNSGQLIKYDLNSSGDINEIYTSDSPSDLKLEDTLTNVEYNEDTYKFGTFKLNKDTIVFYINESDMDESDVYGYEDIDEDNDDTNGYAEVLFYEKSSIGKVEAVVIKDTNFVGASSDYEIAVVERVSTAKNDSDDNVDKLYGFIKGEEVRQLAEDGVDIEDKDNRANVGDILYITYNGDGEIDDVEKVAFDYEKGVVGLAVYDKDSDTIVVWESNDKETYTFADTYYVYKYDNSKDDLTVESYSDIKTVEKNDDNYSEVGLGFNDDDQVEVIVIYSE